MAKRRAKQQFLGDMEPERIREIDDAAANYYDVMQERCKLSKEEDACKDALIDKMKEHQVARYETEAGLVVTITDKSSVKCKPKKSEDEDGEE